MVIEKILHPLQEYPPEDIPRQESPPDSRRMSATPLTPSRILVLRTRKGSYLNKPGHTPSYSGDLRASGKRLVLLE